MVEYFSQFGEIKDSYLIYEKETSRSKGNGYIEYVNIEGYEKCQEKKAHIIDGKKVFSKKHKNDSSQKEYFYQLKEANETEDCSDRKLSLSDKTSNTPNYLPNDSQSKINRKKRGIFNPDRYAKKNCEKNSYDQAELNCNKGDIEKADIYPKYSKNEQKFHKGYNYGPNYDSYGYTDGCYEHKYNSYPNENTNQYQEQFQNQYEHFYDDSNYYNICYPKYAYQHHSLQQNSKYAYEDPNS